MFRFCDYYKRSLLIGGADARESLVRNARPIESAMESNRLVSSSETCEKCHQRNAPVSVKLRIVTKYKDDEANTPTQTVLMMMVDKIHSTHLAPGVAVRHATADRKRETIPWVEYRDSSGFTRAYLASDTKPEQAATMPKFEMECVDSHNRVAHSFETADRAVDAAIASGQIPADLPFIKKTGSRWYRGNTRALMRPRRRSARS